MVQGHEPDPHTGVQAPWLQAGLVPLDFWLQAAITTSLQKVKNLSFSLSFSVTLPFS